MADGIAAAMPTAMPSADHLALGLAAFSIGLGLTELIAPRRVARMAGLIGADARSDGMIRALGFREVSHGVTILANPTSATPVWARVYGDVLDLLALRAGTRRYAIHTRMAAVAAIGLLGAAALDVAVARRLSARGTSSAEHRTVARMEEEA
jgi:hypothetical protein